MVKTRVATMKVLSPSAHVSASLYVALHRRTPAQAAAARRREEGGEKRGGRRQHTEMAVTKRAEALGAQPDKANAAQSRSAAAGTGGSVSPSSAKPCCSRGAEVKDAGGGIAAP
jgi:hypothetical protein